MGWGEVGGGGGGGGPVNHRPNELKFWTLMDHNQTFYENNKQICPKI